MPGLLGAACLPNPSEEAVLRCVPPPCTHHFPSRIELPTPTGVAGVTGHPCVAAFPSLLPVPTPQLVFAGDPLLSRGQLLAESGYKVGKRFERKEERKRTFRHIDKSFS